MIFITEILNCVKVSEVYFIIGKKLMEQLSELCSKCEKIHLCMIPEMVCFLYKRRRIESQNKYKNKKSIDWEGRKKGKMEKQVVV